MAGSSQNNNKMINYVGVMTAKKSGVVNIDCYSIRGGVTDGVVNIDR